MLSRFSNEKHVLWIRKITWSKPSDLRYIMVCNSWFHHHCYTQPDLPGYINSWPHNTTPRVKPHCQLPSSLIQSSYWKKTTNTMYCKHDGLLQRSTETKLEILLHLQLGLQWLPIAITQVVSVNSCALFLAVLVTHMKYLDYCQIVQEDFNFVV